MGFNAVYFDGREREVMTGHKNRPSCTSWFSLPAESYENLISFSSLSPPLCMLHANLLHAGGMNP